MTGSVKLREKHWKALQEHKDYLINTLSVKRLIEVMLRDNIRVFDKCALKEFITTHYRSKQDAARMFVDALSDSDEDTYKKFKTCLKRAGYKDVVKRLKSTNVKKKLTNFFKKNRKPDPYLQFENERLKNENMQLQIQFKNIQRKHYDSISRDEDEESVMSDKTESNQLDKGITDEIQNNGPSRFLCLICCVKVDNKTM
ncbi:hypothetical protein SNE40_006650 [Patella caerulea]|uniref:CARD domain-containing protein n=1 Tax=Patella caerulea TaxID=87958 RepID=A0AAN8PTW0_PATCE